MGDDRVMVTVVPGDLLLLPLVAHASSVVVTLVRHEASVLQLTPLRLLVTAVVTLRSSEGERQDDVFNVLVVVTLNAEGDCMAEI